MACQHLVNDFQSNSFTWQTQQHSCSAHLSQSLLPTCFKFCLSKCVWVCVSLFVCVFECVENQLAALLETNSCLHSSRTCFMHRNTLGSRKWRCQLVAQTYEEQSRLPHSAPLSLSIFLSDSLPYTHIHEHTQSSAQSKDIWFIEVVKAANCWGNRRKTIIVARVCRAAKNAKLTGQLRIAYTLPHVAAPQGRKMFASHIHT